MEKQDQTVEQEFILVSVIICELTLYYRPNLIIQVDS